MANNFGDVLRGLGSVLNPQVLQQVEAEDRQQQQQAGQTANLLLQNELMKQSPEFQMKLEALKNQKGFREAVQGAGGDMTKIASAAMQYGKPEVAMGIYNKQEDRAARLQQAHDALEARRQELEMKISDKSLDREQKDRFNTMMAEMKQQGLNLQGEIARGNQELKKMQFTMKADQDLVKNTQKLQSALEKANLPEADATLGAVEEALKKNPNVAEYINGPKSILPDAVVGPEITQARQAVNKLFNITLKARSGAAVTQQELDRLKQEFAIGVTKKPSQLQDAIDQARNILSKHYTSVTAGFGKDALDAYNENIRGFGGRVVLDSAKPSGGGWSVEEVK